MNKSYILLILFGFICLTFFVLIGEISSPSKRIQVSSATLADISSKDIYFKNNAGVKNSNIAFSNKDIAKNSNVDFKNNDINLDDKNNFSDIDVKVTDKKMPTNASNVNLRNNYSYPSASSVYMQNKPQKINNTKNENLTLSLNPEDLKILEESGEIEDLNNIKIEDMEKIKNIINEAYQEAYAYKNLNWNTWRSNFINKIARDSLKIHELDNYPLNSSIYYRFNVDKNGRVYNIIVMSKDVDRADTEKLKTMIQNYSYTKITKFPQGSNRNVVSLSSLMILTDEGKDTSASDFHDWERVKYKVDNN